MAFSNLPRDLFSLKVLSRLSTHDIFAVAQVCKRWNLLAREELERNVLCAYCQNVVVSSSNLLYPSKMLHGRDVVVYFRDVSHGFSLFERLSDSITVIPFPANFSRNSHDVAVFCCQCGSNIGTAGSSVRSEFSYMMVLRWCDTIWCDSLLRFRDTNDTLCESREDTIAASPSCCTCDTPFLLGFWSSFIGTVYHKLDTYAPMGRYLAFRYITGVVQCGTPWEGFRIPPRQSRPKPTIVKHVTVCCANCRQEVGIQITGCANDDDRFLCGNVRRYFLDPLRVKFTVT